MLQVAPVQKNKNTVIMQDKKILRWNLLKTKSKMETQPYAIKIKEVAVTNIPAWWHSSISVNRSDAAVQPRGGRRSFWSLTERMCDVNLHNYCCSPASQCPVCLTHVTVLLLSFPVLHLILPTLWLSCLSFLTEAVPRSILQSSGATVTYTTLALMSFVRRYHLKPAVHYCACVCFYQKCLLVFPAD